MLWMLLLTACERYRYVDCDLTRPDDGCDIRECCVFVRTNDTAGDPERRCWVEIDEGDIRVECSGRGDNVECAVAAAEAQAECARAP